MSRGFPIPAMSLIFLPLLFSLVTSAQSSDAADAGPYAAVDKVALALPDSQAATTRLIADYMAAHFATERERARAAFIWVAVNIGYDVPNMYVFDPHEKMEEKIAKTLATRKGVCINFAAVFNDICRRCGLRSDMVTGYVKQHGEVDAKLSHVWCAARVDGQWFLFDPTWGAGYYSRGVFVPKINDSFFMARPERLIGSHMPFDPMWQCLTYPVTGSEFGDGNTAENKSKPIFSFADSIDAYEGLNPGAQYTATTRRMVANNEKTKLVADELRYLQRALEQYDTKQAAAVYNSAMADYNDGVSAYNNIMHSRDAIPQPGTPDTEDRSAIDSAYSRVKRAKTKMDSIKEPGSLAPRMAAATKAIDNLMADVKEEKERADGKGSK
jgi:hypothetical protein